MEKDIIAKIISTLLALLGIWTANKISQGLTRIGDATTQISAGFPGGGRK